MGIHNSNSPNFRHSYESRGRDFKQQSFQRKPTRFNVSDAAKNPQRCFNCNDICHLSKSCPNHSRGPRCLSCNLYGHKSFECRRANLSNTSAPPSGVNAVHELSSPINMCKDVTIFGRKLNGLVDTGSNLTLLRNSTYINIDAPSLKQTNTLLTDLKNGFFHVAVNERSRKFTSFLTHNGQYQFRRMPFGLSTCPSAFMRYINAIFRHLISKSIVLPYMDDVVIPAANESQALKYLKIVLQVACDYGLEINFKKCQFLHNKIEFLGHIIENGRLFPSPSKTKAVINYPDLKNIKDVRRFLGLTGYF
ncbi:retrovirus-related Pol polyprotein from transposon 297 [Trichonephila clavipes]|nr:retrovirus-related Pol polyprotein from transposon 297 [Trichonephila clavipes]